MSKKKAKKNEATIIEALLGILGLIFIVIGGLFNLIGTSIAGGILIFSIIYTPNKK